VCAVLSSVCATTVDNSGVYVYYLKGVASPRGRGRGQAGQLLPPTLSGVDFEISANPVRQLVR